VYFSIHEDIKTFSRRGDIYTQITNCDKELLLRVPNECVVKWCLKETINRTCASHITTP